MYLELKTEIDEHRPVPPAHSMFLYKDWMRNGCNDGYFEHDVIIEEFEIEVDELSPHATSLDNENVDIEDIFSTHYGHIPPGHSNSDVLDC